MSNNPIPLLPCPWCGSDNVGMCLEDWWDGNTPAIWCKGCGAIGPVGDSCEDDLKVAAAWNKGPYADREEAHAQALRDHANELTAKAQEHLTKAAELVNKAANMRHEALQLAGECEG